MKLYTEEQVKIAYSKGNNDGYCGIQRDFIGLNLMPIELPTDEDVDKQAFQVPYNGTDTFYDKSFINGAKWMKEQILNQNK